MDTAPLTSRLSHAITTWANSLRHIVPLAAEFADSGEWDSIGAPSAAHWVAEAADIEVCTARDWIRVGRRLRELPETAAAFADDHVSYSKVRTLCRTANAENEAELLALAEQTPAGHLGRAIAAWVSNTSDEAELTRRQHEQRSVTWRIEPDAMVVFTLRLVPEVAGALVADLTSRVMRSTTVEVAPWPSVAQQHADAFAELMEQGGGAATTEVVLHVRGDGCTLDDGTPIAGSVVERIAPESFVRALIHDAESRPVDASSRRRHPTLRQKRVVKERDRVCVDCGASVLLQYDHNPDYTISKRTLTSELELRCAPCHQTRHRRQDRPAA